MIKAGEEPVNVASYVIQMREKLEGLSALSQEQMAQAQQSHNA